MCCIQAVYRQLNSRILYASMAGVWDNKNRRAHGEGFIVGGAVLIQAEDSQLFNEVDRVLDAGGRGRTGNGCVGCMENEVRDTGTPDVTQCVE